MPVQFQMNSGSLVSEKFRRTNRFKQVKFSLFLFSFELVLFCLFLRFGKYTVTTDATVPTTSVDQSLGGGARRLDTMHLQRNFTFQVILLMVFIGNACYMLRVVQFRVAGLMLCLVIMSLAIQWSLMCKGLLDIMMQVTPGLSVIHIDIHSITESLLATQSLMVGMVALLGKVAPISLLFVIFLHIPTFNVVRFLVEHTLLVHDSSYTMSIHLFGAFFGWTAHAIALLFAKNSRSRNDQSKDTQEGICLQIGSLAMFLGLPFVSGILSESDPTITRGIVNTVISGTSAIICSFGIALGWSHFRQKSIDPYIFHGALLSGGIGTGSVAILMTQPFGAMLIGMGCGTMSALTYLWIEPYLQRKLNIPSSLGILSFHGIPSLVGGVTGIIMAALAEDKKGTIAYNLSLYPLYPGRLFDEDMCSPHENSTKFCRDKLGEIISNHPHLDDIRREGRSALGQAGYQAAGLTVSLSLALLVGAITGLAIRLSAMKLGNRFPVALWMSETFIMDGKCLGKNTDENSRGRSRHELLPRSRRQQQQDIETSANLMSS